MIDMQVTEVWIAIEISNGVIVTAYGPFDTRSEVMTFLSRYNSEGYDGEVVVRKLRRPPSSLYWYRNPFRRSRKAPSA